MLQKLIATDDNALSFIARITLGIVIFPHGAQKLFGWFGGHGFSWTMNFFTEWGFPAFLVVLLILTEAIGTLSLIAGFLGRLWAAAIGVVMIVAVLKAHTKYFFMNWYAQPRGEGFEYHILALGLVAIVLIAGSGRWSADRALAKRGRL